jgi:hypothetical protein
MQMLPNCKRVRSNYIAKTPTKPLTSSQLPLKPTNFRALA